MLRHIVWWTLKPHTNNQSAAENVYFLHGASAELQNNPHTMGIEVSAKVDDASTVPAQLVLLATFEDINKKIAFENDPIIQRFLKLVEERANSKNIIDYEVLPNT